MANEDKQIGFPDAESLPRNDLVLPQLTIMIASSTTIFQGDDNGAASSCGCATDAPKCGGAKHDPTGAPFSLLQKVLP